MAGEMEVAEVQGWCGIGNRKRSEITKRVNVQEEEFRLMSRVRG